MTKRPRHVATLLGWKASALALLLFLTASAAGAGAASQPASRAVTFDDALARAGLCADELRRLRIGPDTKTTRALDQLREGLAILDAADRLLAAELAHLPVGPEGGRKARKQGGPRRHLRLQRCRLALRRGDLYRLAAAALPPGRPERPAHVKSALGVFAELRVEYREFTLARMGYIGEARVRRLAGDLRAADKALEHLPARPARRATTDDAELARIARLERLENLLAADPQAAIRETLKWRDGRVLADKPQWRARLDWLLARAGAARAEDADNGRIDETAKLLRNPAVAEVVPAHDRLAVLAKLDELSGGRLMTVEELFEWADLLGSVDHPKAAAVYARAKAGSVAYPSAARMLRYARSLWRARKLLPAADACDELLEKIDANHARRGIALQLRAACLLRAYTQKDAASRPGKLKLKLKLELESTERVLAALWEVVESRLGSDVRTDALRQWAAIEVRATPLAVVAERIARHQTLVDDDDAYLAFTHASGRWQRLRVDAANPNGDQTKLIARARRIVADLMRVHRLAEAGRDVAIVARSALLRGRILAAEPIADPQGALKQLAANEGPLSGDPAVVAGAKRLRVELLLKLGLVEPAADLLGDISQSGARPDWADVLKVAGGLAALYADTPIAGRALLQQKVKGFCSSAVEQAAGDAEAYAGAGRKAARILLEVKAHAMAGQILHELLRSRSIRDNADALRECTLMEAEILLQAGKLDDALQRVVELAKRFPDSPEVYLARGRFELTARQPAKAVVSFRRARKLVAPGSTVWCRATLALAEAHVEQGRRRAADDILRVADALYPDFGNAELLRKLKKARGSPRRRVAREARPNQQGESNRP